MKDYSKVGDFAPAIVDVLERMLRRLKADEIKRVASITGQEPPHWAVNDTLATNGVEGEAKYLVHFLKSKMKNQARPRTAKASPGKKGNG